MTRPRRIVEKSGERLTLSQLAAQSATTVPSIKFYLREGILPGGDLSAEHRGFYSAAHVRRLRVVHALRQVGGLSIQAIRGVCQLLDADRPATSGVVARTMDALGRREARRPPWSGRELSRARDEVLEFLEGRGIEVRACAASVERLAAALVALRHAIGPEIAPAHFVPYLEAMLSLAQRDFQDNQHLFADPETAAESAAQAVVLGTVLWEPVLLLLRRITLEHVASKKLPKISRAR
jgi:DNA-binding transcriptional MerR regulator